ncbi:MAG TPA: glucokinase [Blastocatellia bacterium]|nr:glucokinase [Blastocatellia bacterium]
MILAGDVGGTSTRLAFFTIEGGRLNLVVEKDYPSHRHKGLDEIVGQFVSHHRLAIEYACFGIAGPVQHQRVETPNLPWVVDQETLAGELRIQSVWLINDLVANTYGALMLEEKDLAVLNPGSPNAGNAAVISAGTGLGEAGAYWDGKHFHPFACEGGHADFAPRNDLEVDLLRYLLKTYGHASWERVVSGPGLLHIFNFLRETGHGEAPGWLLDEMEHGDPSAAISKAALEGKCGLCEQALDLFISCFGSEAGNLALKLLATGGVYIGGGIAPKILQKLRGPAFLESFVAKGRFKHLLEAIPVRVILNDKAALFGAARYAGIQATLM